MLVEAKRCLAGMSEAESLRNPLPILLDVGVASRSPASIAVKSTIAGHAPMNEIIGRVAFVGFNGRRFWCSLIFHTDLKNTAVAYCEGSPSATRLETKRSLGALDGFGGNGSGFFGAVF